MLIQEIIKKKRDGLRLDRQEIEFFIKGCCDGSIPDYQSAALLMAIFCRGMQLSETADLTRAMTHSGEVVNFNVNPAIVDHLSRARGLYIDKHSTGGVGDKVSIILAPLVAALGVNVPMISGRSLGHTGGTLDKLESIPGFNTRLSLQEFKQQVDTVGCCLIGQTSEIAPADRKLYALRDVTGTVECQPLITSSILSKKFAEGIDGLVMDVKVGSGAFMKKVGDAEALAQMIIGIGKQMQKSVVAVLTDMNQPLGINVGNALEIAECIEVMRGKGPKDLIEVTLELGYWMMKLAGVENDRQTAFANMTKALQDGTALKKFADIVKAQKGNVAVCDNPMLLPQAKHRRLLKSVMGGFVTAIDTEAVGMAALVLGAGRIRANDQVDAAVGFRILKKLGDAVAVGEPLLEVHYTSDAKLADIDNRLLNAYTIDERPAPGQPLIIKTLQG